MKATSLKKTSLKIPTTKTNFSKQLNPTPPLAFLKNKVYDKLAQEAKKIRKGTIDVEDYLAKNTTEETSKQHQIKRGYYSKLGIERPSLSSSTFKYPSATKKEAPAEADANTKIKKSSSSDIKADKPLEISKEEEKSPHSENGPVKKEIPEPKVDDITKLGRSTNLKQDNRIKKIKARDRTRKLSMMDDPNQVALESYETTESGNWRLDLLNTPIMARSGDRIRQDLLSKLTYQKIWLTPSEKPTTHQTVFIYDWDDTLLCTSFLNPTGFYEEDVEIPELAKKHLAKLEKAVEKLITSSVKLGKTYIVTNAAEGWVQFSSKKYMPKVYSALEGVEVISARSLFEQQFPGDSYEWKMQAFTNIQKDLESSMITNIIA